MSDEMYHISLDEIKFDFVPDRFERIPKDLPLVGFSLVLLLQNVFVDVAVVVEEEFVPSLFPPWIVVVVVVVLTRDRRRFGFRVDPSSMSLFLHC